MKKSSIILGSLMGLAVTVTAVSAAFSDVKQGDWFYNAVTWGQDTKLIEGYQDGTFKPHQTITRAETSVLFYRYNDMVKKEMDAMTAKLTAMEKKIEELEKKLDENKVNTVAGEEWNIIKDHVTSNYPISEAYFDEHFKFISTKSNVIIHGDEWEPLLSDVTMVDYSLQLDDAEGNPQNFNHLNYIYLQNGEVLEEDDLPKNLSEKEKNKLKIYTYEPYNPTYELKILLTKDEAIDIAKSTPGCVDENFFNIDFAEENINLKTKFNEIVWNWYDIGGYCDINAETAEVEVYQESEVVD